MVAFLSGGSCCCESGVGGGRGAQWEGEAEEGREIR